MSYCLNNISQLVTLSSAYKKDGRNLTYNDLSIIEDAALIYTDDTILWIGKSKDLPKNYSFKKEYDFSSKVVCPAIVDSHTHTVFGGDRAYEYGMRLNGESYEKIAQAGGAILSTVKATQNESFQQLFEKACDHLQRIRSYGVKAVEIKSGYGLTYESEKKITQVISSLKNHFKNKLIIKNTFLAAHAVPKEYKTSHDYLNKVVLPLLNELAADIDFVDIFHEINYFTSQDVHKLFTTAQSLGIARKIHADEFNDNQGAELACKFNCASADHLLKTNSQGIKALAKSSTVATLLPGTALFLGKPLADAKKFLDAGCKVALASDFNPGSCHFDNILKIASLSAAQTQMNLAQIWAAITLNSAHALDLKELGAITLAHKPLFSVFNCKKIEDISYNWSLNLSENF